MTLAETCKLDVFLAHVERFMIQHMDASFWPGALASGSGGISQQCFLRVLRGALHGRQEAIEAFEKQQLPAPKTLNGYQICSNCEGYWSNCRGTCAPSAKRSKIDRDALDVSITTLTQWHKQDS